MKIAVIGYSGSGKSTLAGKLAARNQMEPLYLDTVFWLPGWKERSREEMREIVSSYLDTHEEWVIDGNYSKICFKRRMQEADRIILMQFSAFSCLFRAWKRYRQNKGKARASMAEGCPEKLDLEFIWWLIYEGRKKGTRGLHRWVREQYPEKTVRLRNQRQLDEFERRCGLCLK